MAAVPVTIVGTATGDDGVAQNVTVQGDLTITGLTVGGGPAPGGKPPEVSFPIWGPPGSNFPDKPGYPPEVGGGPIIPPDLPTEPPDPDAPLFVAVWHPDLGWILIPTFPLPTPS